MSGYKAPIAIHPGETLKDILEASGMSQVQLSARTGLHVVTINNIIKGKDSITSETALKLSIVFGMSEGFWNNLQKNYEETAARIDLEDALDKELNIVRKFTCYNELSKYNYVPKTRDLKEKAKNLLSFLGITSFKYLEDNYSVAFRKSPKAAVSKENLIAWLRCGEIDASKIETKPFNKLKLKTSLAEIKSLNLLSVDKYSDKLRDLLAGCGIAVAYVPYLKKTFVNGAARWLNAGEALIQLTPRYKYEDIFWFTLFHELCHVLKHGKKEGYISFWEKDYLNKDYIEIEREADLFAAENLIPSKRWNKFFASNRISSSTIIDFAKEAGVKPGIVAGRLAQATGQWSKLAPFRKQIKISA